MKLVESNFASQIEKTVENKLGFIFFIEDIAIVELHEGIHFDMNNSYTVIDEFIAYFGSTKPYGVIANRANSYSVNLLHAPFFKTQAKNVLAYGVVGHNMASRMNAEIENGFCTSEKVDYNSISEAIKTVSEKVKKYSFSFN